MSLEFDETIHNLLRINLDLTGTDGKPKVVFDIRVGGEQVGLQEASVEEIGLPLTLRDAREQERSGWEKNQGFRIPDYLLTALESVLPRIEEPLWLSLIQPYGYLPIIPWERLLRQQLACPILRVPYSRTTATPPQTSIDMVVCFSFPLSKQHGHGVDPDLVIYNFIRQFPRDLTTPMTLHLFVDAQKQIALRDLSREFSNLYRVRIYQSGGADHYDVPPRSDEDSFTSTLKNPWLLWIRDSLAGITADIVHFVCHGYLGRDQGNLAFSQSSATNEDASWARFVGARQLSLFLEEVGAWALSMSSPPGNYSMAGLRFLHEQMAQLHCGPVLLHEMVKDDDNRALNQAYGYLCENGPQQPPTSSAISLYCHPQWVRHPSSRSIQAKQLSYDLTLTSRLDPDFFEKGKAPAFARNMQRSLERSVSQLQSDPNGEEGKATQQGAEDALRFTSDVVARHLKKWRMENLP